MRISWNKEQSRFEVTFDSASFQNDLEVAKEAGFKTEGPPSWVWFTSKAKVLKKLKELRPTGIAITQDALNMFGAICVEEDKREANKKFVADLKARAAGKPTEDEKKVKREEREAKRRARGLGPIKKRAPRARGGQRTQDVNRVVQNISLTKYVPPMPPTTLCIFCLQPVYDVYEKVDPLPVCLWCEKTIGDNQRGDE